MMTYSNESISTYDSLIRSGKAESVRQNLLNKNYSDLSKTPRAQIAELATIARRVALPELSIRLLQPFVRPKSGIKEQPTAKELAVYASALSKLGAHEEALEILEANALADIPEAQLYLAHTHIYRWDYTSAASCLRKYIKTPQLNQYDRTIGMLNLAACHQFNGIRSEEKNALLETLLADTQANGWQRLFAGSLELAAQNAIDNKAWTQASEYIARADATGAGSSLLLAKWQAILLNYESGANSQHLEKLLAVRERAFDSGDVETVRECDLYRALFTNDEALASYVYFGTSHPSYQTFITRLLSRSNFGDSFVWNLKDEKPERIFDIQKGSEVSNKKDSKPGKTLLRLFEVLSSDFYLRFHLTSLFSKIYPGEYYNPENSQARVRRALARLREWFEEEEIPLSIDVTDGTARLRALKPYGIRVINRSTLLSRTDESVDNLRSLKQAFPYRAFTSTDAAEHLGFSKAKAIELLKKGLARGKVYSSGQGRALRYRFSK